MYDVSFSKQKYGIQTPAVQYLNSMKLVRQILRKIQHMQQIGRIRSSENVKTKCLAASLT
jgi:hypothetical protein